jgi:methylated-DNA-[protein]-cysteine S-methyltransferase
MEVVSGSCRFGLLFVRVWWSGDLVGHVTFSQQPLEGPAPPGVVKFLAGNSTDLLPLRSVALEPGSPYVHIYREVLSIPYGSTATYGDIARRAGSSPRMVGLAMKRNPTPLFIPCHRVVSKTGIGGFTPSVEIKRMLMDLEQKRKSYN